MSPIFLKRTLVFPILLFSSISLGGSLRKAFLSLLAILWSSASNGNTLPFLLCFSLLFFSQLFVRPPQTAILHFCISFSWGWSWSLSPIHCHEWTFISIMDKRNKMVYQVLYSSVSIYRHGQDPSIINRWVQRWATDVKLINGSFIREAWIGISSHPLITDTVGFCDQINIVVLKWKNKRVSLPVRKKNSHWGRNWSSTFIK